MKRSVFFASILAITLVAGGSAFAQAGGYYYVAYFSNANTVGAPDATLRFVNDGAASTAVVQDSPNGTLSASLYVFDDSQEMQECCNCTVSADGLLSESVNNNLTSNTLTGGRAERTRGVIKIISSLNPDPTANVLRTGLRGTITHLQASSTSSANGFYYVTETPVARSNLSNVELQDLEITCGFVMYLGSGQGVCSCTPEGSDF